MIPPTTLLDVASLKALAEAAPPPPGLTPCACGLDTLRAWESVTEHRWPATQLDAVGTLRQPDIDEPTFEEYHPDGTRYDSVTAPIAVRYFPFNRCNVYRCRDCGQLLLRYTEFGGYYVDHRARAVDPALIVP